MTRTDARFGEIAAWLYRPDADGTVPIVVMAHGLSGTRDLGLPAYAERFRAAGLGVLLFDYRGFGDSGGEPRQVIDIAMQLDDWRAAIAHARSIDWADPDRVALFGSSFSGGHAVVLAADDPRIAAIAIQCPFQDALASIPMLDPRSGLRNTGHLLKDLFTMVTGRPPHTIPAVAPPGEAGLITTPDAKPGMLQLVPAGSKWRNEVAARYGLQGMRYRPGTRAAEVRCPALWCVCENDSMIPAKSTIAFAKQAPRGELREYPIGHFDIYVGEWFERAVADQTEFLVRHLVTGERAAPAEPRAAAAPAPRRGRRARVAG